MKSMFHLIRAAAAVLMFSLAFAGCQKITEPEPEPKPDPEPDPQPRIELLTEKLEIGAEGGILKIEYKLENPNDSSKIAAATPADWIRNFNFDTEGIISFEVLANEAEADREAGILVSYPGAEAVPEIRVHQKAAEAPADFEVTIHKTAFNSIEYSVVRADKTMNYICFVMTQAMIEEKGLQTDEALWEDDLALFRKDAESYGETLEQTISFYCQTKDIDHQTLSNLLPDTDYVLYVYGIEAKENEATRLTDIVRTEFKTAELEKIEASFDISYEISGPFVQMTVTPQGYDGPYYYDVLKGTLENPQAEDQAVSMWMEKLSFFNMVGYSPAEIIKEACFSGTQTFEIPLEPSTEYTGFVMAISSETALPYSDASVKSFVTGDQEPSNNQLTITVESIKDRSADIMIMATTMDPYSYVVLKSQMVEGMSDDEIIQYCIDYTFMESVEGSFAKKIKELSPNTAYSVLAFGKSGQSATTGLFRKDFTTKEAVVGNATIELEFDKYYDIKAVAELDPSVEQYLDYGQVFMPCKAVTDPADASVVYYSFFATDIYEQFGQELTDEFIMDMLIAGGPMEGKETSFILNYNENTIAAAIVEDANGNFSKLWRSEIFTLDQAGASDPQEFIDAQKSPRTRSLIRIPLKNR